MGITDGAMPEGYGTPYARRVAEYAGAAYSDARRCRDALLEIETMCHNYCLFAGFEKHRYETIASVAREALREYES